MSSWLVWFSKNISHSIFSGKTQILWTDVLLSIVIFGGFVTALAVGVAGLGPTSVARHKTGLAGLIERARVQQRLEPGSFR